MPLDIFRDWRPVTIRAKSRETLAVGSRDLKDHLAQVMVMVARGDVRVVVRRHRDLMGALVPMPDYWFLVELEEELRRRRCPGAGRRVGGREVAEAIIEIREEVKAAERKRLLGLKRAEAAERKQAEKRMQARDGRAKAPGRSGGVAEARGRSGRGAEADGGARAGLQPTKSSASSSMRSASR